MTLKKTNFSTTTQHLNNTAMNQNPFPTGTTRRSFIKRSVVAAVALSSMTIFSGLVNATLPGSTGTETKKPCKVKRQIVQSANGVYLYTKCFFENSSGCTDKNDTPCGPLIEDNTKIVNINCEVDIDEDNCGRCYVPFDAIV